MKADESLVGLIFLNFFKFICEKSCPRLDIRRLLRSDKQLEAVRQLVYTTRPMSKCLCPSSADVELQDVNHSVTISNAADTIKQATLFSVFMLHFSSSKVPVGRNTETAFSIAIVTGRLIERAPRAAISSRQIAMAKIHQIMGHVLRAHSVGFRVRFRLIIHRRPSNTPQNRSK